MKKKFFFVTVITLSLCSFQLSAQKNNGADTSLYIKENVAIVDAIIRSIDQGHYVKELFMVDFKKTIRIPTIFEFDDDVFTDNGVGYDAIAGDGIYTSSEQYMHSNSIPYQNGISRRSVMESCIIDVHFNQKVSLESYLKSYVIPGSHGKFIVSIDCDIYVCNCSSCSCRTCGWPILGPGGTYIGYVQHCLKIVNCHFEITWE